MSTQFCRKIVGKSFKFLKYLYVNLPDIMNLITIFYSSCDYKGEFNFKGIPEGLEFMVEYKD